MILRRTKRRGEREEPCLGKAGEGGRVQISREMLLRAGGRTKTLRNVSFLNRQIGGYRLCQVGGKQ